MCLCSWQRKSMLQRKTTIFWTLKIISSCVQWVFKYKHTPLIKISQWPTRRRLSILCFIGELGSLVSASSSEDRPKYIVEITVDSGISFRLLKQLVALSTLPTVPKYPTRAPFSFPHSPVCLSMIEDSVNYSRGFWKVGYWELIFRGQLFLLTEL